MIDHCIILEHGALMEYEINMFLSLEKHCFHSQSCYFDVFLIMVSLLDLNSETISK
jgi:hypothetical protein